MSAILGLTLLSHNAKYNAPSWENRRQHSDRTVTVQKTQQIKRSAFKGDVNLAVALLKCHLIDGFYFLITGNSPLGGSGLLGVTDGKQQSSNKIKGNIM